MVSRRPKRNYDTIVTISWAAGKLPVFILLLTFCLGHGRATGVRSPESRLHAKLRSSQQWSNDQIHKFPCRIVSFAQSGDGSTIWVNCENPNGLVGSSKDYPSVAGVYVLDTSSGMITRLAGESGPVSFIAAPVGRRLILVRPQTNSLVLYEGSEQIAELPIKTSSPVWDAGGTHLYFNAGSTTNTDEWNILGVLSIKPLRLSKIRLVSPTEAFHVCAKTGHFFTGDPVIDRRGELVGNSVEYKADASAPRRRRNFLPGDFSASCQYVATEHSFHGPVPWEISEVDTGRRLMYFDFTGEGAKDEIEFQSWNPRVDNLFLAFLDIANRSSPESPERILQLFDVGQKRAIAVFPDVPADVQWLRDGNSIVFSRKDALVIRKVSSPEFLSSP